MLGGLLEMFEFMCCEYDTDCIVAVMMEEAKLSNFQRRKLNETAESKFLDF